MCDTYPNQSKVARLESAYSLIWGVHQINGQDGGQPLALL